MKNLYIQLLLVHIIDANLLFKNHHHQAKFNNL